jgi:hypothetical protein
MHPMLSLNAVKVAVQRAGGPTHVAIALGCSGTTVHNWIRQRKITDLTKAQKLADLSGMTVRELRPCR